MIVLESSGQGLKPPRKPNQSGGSQGTPNDPGNIGDETNPVQDDKKKRKRSGKGSIFLNDSTRNVYGPKTTLSISEEDLFFNRKNYRPIDTTILNLHRWGYVQKYENLYQDLGNVGTALNSIYPVVRNFSGAVTGFNSYRLYFDSKYPKYYDTKSPYAKMTVIWGGAGRSMTNIEFTRNINSRWNFGFNYRPILVDKQMQRQRRGDRNVLAHYYDFFMSFRSKDEKFLSLFNFRRTRHRVFENGGVYLKKTDKYDEYFNREASPRLVAAESAQLLRNIHWFNQYSLANAFQVYNTMDYTRESNNFTDNFSKENRSDTTLFDHWERVTADTLRANDIYRMITFQNELGMKGRANFLFYNVYYKVRSYINHYEHNNPLPPTTVRGVGQLPIAPGIQQSEYNVWPRNFSGSGVEQYLGGRLAFDIDSLTRLSGQAEINQLGNYSIDAKFASKWIDASFLQSISRPGFLYTNYIGSHDFWTNSFRNEAGLKLEGFLKTPFKRFLFSPGLSYTLFSNYLYFRKDDAENYGAPFGQWGSQTVLPVQSAAVINVMNPQLRLGIGLGKKVKLSGSVINNLILSDAEGAMKIPDWLASGQLALEDFWFKKNLQVHVGIDVTWRSAYYAMGYDYAIQQYYVQNDVKINSAFIADVFLNARLKTGRFFVKYHNLAQLFQSNGYLITPGYPGQRNILDFGFELIMFD